MLPAIRFQALLLASAILCGCGIARSPEAALRAAFRRTTGRIQLPSGIVELRAPLILQPGAHDLEITGAAGSVLRMVRGFQGRAAIVGIGVSGIRLAGFEIIGSRESLVTDRYLPPSNRTFAEFYDENGLLFTDSRGLRIENITLRNIKAFPVLIARSADVDIAGVSIRDSGTLNAQRRSNTTGGILLEEGTSRFSVRNSRIQGIAGNAIWTHSNYHSPLNRDGLIEGNEIYGTPRDAIQVGHAQRIRVVGNRGGRIGAPFDQVDVAALATPVALDSSGDVSDSVYSGNRFTDVDGQCIDLDGFHDGEVSDNACIDRGSLEQYPYLHTGIVFGNSFPEMQPGHVVVKGNTIEGFGYGGLFLIGEGNQVLQNQFIDINRNHCTGAKAASPRCNYALDEPGMLRSGIYLAGHAARPARTEGNVIRDNVISGFGAARWCIASGPGVSLSANRISGNTCTDSR